MRINEENFVKELKKGNEKAIDYVIDNYSWIIKTVVSRHLYGLTAYQDECINDILMATWLNIKSFDENRSEFKNWVAGVAKYKSLEYKRKYLKHQEYENIEDLNIEVEDIVHKELIENELTEDANEMLSCLKPCDRELFLKLYVEEKDIEKIASETGMSRDVIYNRVSRGKRKIKNIFKIVNIGGYSHE
jgi:RNA polymerase sigma-70 factor, ECF subfamily